MISSLTFKTFLWPIKIGYLINALPFTWNEKSCRFVFSVKIKKEKKHLFIWRIFALLNIFLQASLMSHYGKEIYLDRGNDPPFVILSIFILAVGSLSLSLQLHMFFYYEDMMGFLNSFLEFNKTLGEAFEINTPVTQDGLERIFKLKLIAPIYINILIPPVLTLLFHYDVKIVSSLKMDYLIGNIIFSSIYDYISAINHIFIYSYSFIILLYINCITKWLEQHLWLEEYSHHFKLQLGLLYKAHQVLQAFTNQIMFYLIPSLLFSMLLLEITQLYSIFTFYNTLNPVFIFGLCILSISGILTIQVIFKLSEKCCNTSELYSKSFLLEERNCPNYKWTKRFLKTCRPIVWKVTNISEINCEMYLNYMSTGVLDNVLNLVLGYR